MPSLGAHQARAEAHAGVYAPAQEQQSQRVHVWHGHGPQRPKEDKSALRRGSRQERERGREDLEGTVH